MVTSGDEAGRVRFGVTGRASGGDAGRALVGVTGWASGGEAGRARVGVAGRAHVEVAGRARVGVAGRTHGGEAGTCGGVTEVCGMVGDAAWPVCEVMTWGVFSARSDKHVRV